MPEYLYENPENGEKKYVSQGMNEKHEYSEGNVKWNRVFLIPRASIDTKVNPFSVKDFYKATDNKKQTIGDLTDRAKELSEERKAKNGGVDPVLQKEIAKHRKEFDGRPHPSEIKKLNEINISI